MMNEVKMAKTFFLPIVYVLRAFVGEWAVVLACALSAVCSRPALAQSSQVSPTIRLEGDVWAPYVMDAASGHRGFIVDIAELVLTRAGYQVRFDAVPWSRALMNADRGAIDGVVGIYFTQAREKGMVVPNEEIGVSVNTLYTRKESTWRFDGPPSLEAKRLAVVADYDYGELNPYVERLRKGNDERLHVGSGNDVLQRNLRMLLVDRVDVVVEDSIVVNYVAHHMDGDVLGCLRVAGVVEPKNRVGIAFSAKNPHAAEYARALSDGIRKLRQSGELKAILDAYYVKDWK